MPACARKARLVDVLVFTALFWTIAGRYESQLSILQLDCIFIAALFRLGYTLEFVFAFPLQ